MCLCVPGLGTVHRNSNFIMLWAHFTVTVSPSLVSKCVHLPPSWALLATLHWTHITLARVSTLCSHCCLLPANWQCWLWSRWLHAAPGAESRPSGHRQPPATGQGHTSPGSHLLHAAAGAHIRATVNTD